MYRSRRKKRNREYVKLDKLIHLPNISFKYNDLKSISNGHYGEFVERTRLSFYGNDIAILPYRLSQVQTWINEELRRG